MSYTPDPTSPDMLMARRIEGGPEFGSGSLEKAYDALERNFASSKYATLQDTFGARDDGGDPLEGWDADNVAELLRCSIGAAEDFAVEYDQMTEEERAERFPDPTVAELVVIWADLGRQ